MKTPLSAPLIKSYMSGGGRRSEASRENMSKSNMDFNGGKKPAGKEESLLASVLAVKLEINGISGAEKTLHILEDLKI